MSNYAYTSFSTNAPQSPESNQYRVVASDYLNNNPLRASQVVATSSLSSRAIQLPIEDLQMNFTLMAAEVDRLLILNSLMSKEAEQWRKKYLETERSGSQRGGDNSYYQQRIRELEDRLEAKERESRDLKIGSYGGNSEKDREIQYWKDKQKQTENEYLQKIQNIKTQTEGILREQIEREVKTALRYMEEEKKIMQNQLDDLRRERDNLVHNGPHNDFQTRSSSQEKDKEIAYWKDKFQNLEASLEPRIRSAIEVRLQETVTPILREKDELMDQLEMYKRRANNDHEREKRAGIGGSPSRDNEKLKVYIDQLKDYEDRINKLENEKRSLVDCVQKYESRVDHLMNDNSSLADRLRNVEEKSFNLKDSLRSKDDLERQIDNLQDTIRRHENKLRENQHEMENLKLSSNQRFSTQTENENLNRKIKEYDSVIKDQKTEIERLKRATNQTSQIEYEYNNLTRKSREYESELEAFRRNDAHKAEDLNRMRTEIEKIMNQKNELENRIHNYEREKGDYQNSLEVLKQKFREFEGKMSLLLEENERLKAEIQGKDRDITQFKHSQTYEGDLKRQLGTLEDKARDDRNEYMRRIQALEDQINREKNESARLTDLLRSRESEVENWKQKYQNLERDTQSYIQKLMGEAEGHFRNRIDQEKNEFNMQISAEKNAIEKQLTIVEEQLHDREREVSHLRDENSSLSLQVTRLTQEMNNLRGKIESLTRESNTRVEEFRRKYENDQKMYLETELRGLQSQLNDKIILYEQEVNRLTNIIREHELKQILFFIEIERLYLVNGEFIEEINRITEEINNLLAENDKLNHQISSLKQNNQDRARYEELIQGLRGQIDDYEHRIQTLMTENARLSDTAVERLKEINNLKNSFASRANQSETAKRSQPNMSQKSQADFNELNLRFENEKSNMEAQMNQLRQAFEGSKRENIKLQEINNQRKTENDKLYHELEGLRNSSWATQNLETELKLQSEQYQQSLKEVEEMRRARDFYRQQYDQVSAKLKEAFNEKIKDTAVTQNWRQGGSPGYY